jgi:hypothetical protein
MRTCFSLVAAVISVSVLYVSGFALATPAQAELLIEIDKTSQRMTVSRDGVPLHVWNVSTGRAGRDTPSGNFTPFRLEVDHFSREWDNAPMPHSIFFTKRGHAIHGSYEVKKLGSAASAGCVRLEPKNAATLFRMVKAEGLNNVKVEIGGAVVPRRAPRPIDPQTLDQQGLDPQVRDPQLPGQPYRYRDRDSTYPDPYAAQGQYARPDPRQYARPEPRSVRPRYRQPYYYDDYGRPRYVQPYRPQPPQIYYQQRGYGYGWD